MKTLAQKLKQLPKSRQRKIAARARELQAIVQRAAARPIVDPRPAEEILGYERPQLTTRYRCTQCQRTVKRDSEKAWIKSYCDRTDRVVHLQRVNRSVDQAARQIIHRRRPLFKRLS